MAHRGNRVDAQEERWDRPEPTKAGARGEGGLGDIGLRDDADAGEEADSVSFLEEDVLEGNVGRATDDGDEDAGQRALVEPADERGLPPAFLRCTRVVRHSESELRVVLREDGAERGNGIGLSMSTVV